VNDKPESVGEVGSNSVPTSDKPRRSAGMRGNPLNPAPEHRPIPSSPPIKPRPEPSLPVRTSNSRFTQPKVLMGEVTMPIQKFAASRGEEIGKQREAFRAFMQARRLTPTQWARAAGVPTGEVLGFLTGRVRAIAPAHLEKLAQAAGCAPEDMLK
jgi:DNA-binding Xre family transcriptional regulator